MMLNALKSMSSFNIHKKIYKYFEPILLMEKLRLRLSGFHDITRVQAEWNFNEKFFIESYG